MQAFTIAYTISQIGTVYWGSGFHTRNIPDEWLEWHWHVRQAHVTLFNPDIDNVCAVYSWMGRILRSYYMYQALSMLVSAWNP